MVIIIDAARTWGYSVYTIKNPKRKTVCQKEKYVDTYLKKISLEMFRNFMMHSDDSNVTKVETIEDALSEVKKIFEATKEIFEYFNDQFTIQSGRN
ncbi:hypothetical protein ES705_41237 [subsurface metagenome]